MIYGLASLIVFLVAAGLLTAGVLLIRGGRDSRARTGGVAAKRRPAPAVPAEPGAADDEPRRCTACEHPNSDNAVFCGRCGHRLDEPAAHDASHGGGS